MNSQVLSIEQMQKLQKLGVDISNGSMMWINYYESCSIKDVAELRIRDVILEQSKEYLPTFTLQDILEMLPVYIDRANVGLNIMPLSMWDFRYEDVINECEPIVVIEDSDILQAAYKMLVWCIKNDHMKGDYPKLINYVELVNECLEKLK